MQRSSESPSASRSIDKATVEETVKSSSSAKEHEHHPAHPPTPAHRASAATHAHASDTAADRQHRAHDRHAGHSVEMFRDKFWITLALTVPTLVSSHMIQGWFGFSAPSFPGSAYIPAVFGTAVYLYGGRVFLEGGIRELRDRVPGMMTLISLAISVAFFFSLAVTLGFPGDLLWWELATLVTIMLLGHWIDMRSILQASGALRDLLRLLPSTAQRLVRERVEEVPIVALREGDLVLVRPGESIPADGLVRSGKSDVNESMITGESVPVAKTEGAKVIAGTVNGSGSLRVEVTGTGEHTALAEHHAPRRAGADVAFARAGPSRSRGIPADADCHRGRRADTNRVDGCLAPQGRLRWNEWFRCSSSPVLTLWAWRSRS